MITCTNNQIENNVPRERPLGRVVKICVFTGLLVIPLSNYLIYIYIYLYIYIYTYI